MINKLLLAGHKLIFKMHLMQSGFTYSVCRLLLKAKDEYKNL